MWRRRETSEAMTGSNMPTTSSDSSLMTQGFNISDSSSAADFLEALLDDTELKVIGEAYAKYFCVGVVVIIGMTALIHVARYSMLVTRLHHAAAGQDGATRPGSRLTRSIATIAALGREASYLQLTPTSTARWLQVPPLGIIALLVVYLGFVLALEYINNDIPGSQHWQALGVRAGWLAVAQMPWIILLAGKANIIGVFTNLSYERLGVLHAWTSRMMLLLAILHFGYQSHGWEKYGLMKLEWLTDDCPTTGIAAFALLLWMNISSVAPLRSWPSYEIFVLQHVLTFCGFIVAILLHLPSTAPQCKVYIYIPIGFFILDSLIRGKGIRYKSLATLTALDGSATMIRIQSPGMPTWKPGCHIRISISQFGRCQHHPATILSTPRSHGGDLMLLLKSHSGFTKRILKGVSELEAPSAAEMEQGQLQQHQAGRSSATSLCSFEGPYGGRQDDFAAFDSVCLIAGSTGLTFTLAILQNIAERASTSETRLPVRRVHFVWCIKNASWASWASEEISIALEGLEAAGIQAVASIYVTCANAVTGLSDESKQVPCACDSNLGPCCCNPFKDSTTANTMDIGAIAPVSAAYFKDGREKVGMHVSERPATSSSSSSSASHSSRPGASNLFHSPTQLAILPRATFYSGRPDLHSVIAQLVEGAEGESGVAVCGPLGMSVAVRKAVVSKLREARAVHGIGGGKGIYLHVESFS